MAKVKQKYYPKAGSPISEKEEDRFLALYKEHGSYAVVAKICGRSASAVANHIKVRKARKTVIIK